MGEIFDMDDAVYRSGSGFLERLGPFGTSCFKNGTVFPDNHIELHAALERVPVLQSNA
jgi:hypothetical protein